MNADILIDFLKRRINKLESDLITGAGPATVARKLQRLCSIYAPIPPLGRHVKNGDVR
ncbi:MAG: hypothetical protein VB140_07290 [Burkholderia sp.]|nr:MAG: hypothetical protein E5299_00614 [Burkholderia gladioli]